MSREAAAQFFELFGRGHDVPSRLASIEATAAVLVADIEATDKRKDEDTHARGQFLRADVKRWTARNIDLCARTFHEPPPPSLLLLNKRLLNVSSRPRASIKNKQKWKEAATFCAEHPRANFSAIRRAINYDQPRQIKIWLSQPEFIEEVERIRSARRGSKKPIATPP